MLFDAGDCTMAMDQIPRPLTSRSHGLTFIWLGEHSNPKRLDSDTKSQVSRRSRSGDSPPSGSRQGPVVPRATGISPVGTRPGLAYRLLADPTTA
ncbi:hypothetical protein PoB_004342600 [Plakobranchus ocellatus]|uniref:Uncharacterized protein n=1 Tax=Plakobranchus ocellatus TaxID=259542 RepID=A0AAV4BDP1_9GAST|nr:hypothetical protein PoB_004342600 [Plakobranchus ocellatus]